MDQFDKKIEEAFKKAVEANSALDKEAEEAVDAFKEACMPTWIIAGHLVPGIEQLSKAVTVLNIREPLFELMRLYFYAGFSKGREEK